MKRSFPIGDTRSFAALSRDANPLHVDPVAARRTVMGGCVVHGILTLLWALDRLWPDKDGMSLASVDARFLRPLRVGDECTLAVTDRTDDLLSFEVAADGECLSKVKVELRRAGAEDHCDVGQAAAPPAAPQARTLAECKGAAGRIRLAALPDLLERTFPRLARLVPHGQIALLLASTQLVGMECPGLHSIYSSLRVSFAGMAGEADWKVERVEPALGRVVMSMACGGTRAEIAAFRRPDPRGQPSLADIRARIAPPATIGQRAVVIGGSRGLGELTAKILGAGGAAVRLSWANGQADGERVAGELRAAGQDAQAFRFDATAGEPLPSDIADWRPTHLYYFATPSIQPYSGSGFPRAQFDRYCAYYLDGFAAVAAPLIAIEPGLRVLYPSSTFLDVAPRGFTAYVCAKAAGEAYCRTLIAAHPGLMIRQPRLPPLDTDQTASILARRTADAVEAMAAEITALAGV